MVLRAFSRWVERQHKKVVDKMEATWNDIVQGIDDDNQLTEADEMFHPVMAAKKQWESAANVKAAAAAKAKSAPKRTKSEPRSKRRNSVIPSFKPQHDNAGAAQQILSRPTLPLPQAISLDSAAAVLDSKSGENGGLPKTAGAKIRSLLPAASAEERDVRAKRLASAARRMRDPAYSLKEFYGDMLLCFPELTLYFVYELDEEGSVGRSSVHKTSSGLSAEDEYLRTVGALFAVYWLMRLDLPAASSSSASSSSPPAAAARLQGQFGFCYGVDTQWRPYNPLDGKAAKVLGVDDPLMHKRDDFHKGCDWHKLQDLMVHAGLLKPGPAQARGGGSLVVDEERTVAMLVLTAFHDIMKLSALLPTVTEADAPYAGLNAGETIIDHDLALSYVLECDPGALPSYDGLPEEQKRAIKFTQADLGFNHGWLVQGEAPPGALFSQIKSLLDKGGLPARDVAFYFVHWVTDVAGAEPTPLQGVEKFVLKFPLPVFTSLVKSMGIVEKLAERSPIEVYSGFLHDSWADMAPHLPEESSLVGGAAGGTGAASPLPPTGPFSIASMRLILHAQEPRLQRQVADALDHLPTADCETLGLEMALTGVEGAAHAATPNAIGGPAFLVYYGPAFIRRAAGEQMALMAAEKGNKAVAAAADISHGATRIALRMLAEVYRAARQLWPRSSEGSDGGKVVTIHMGEFKGRSVFEIAAQHYQGACWLLVKKSATEAAVELHSFEAMARAPIEAATAAATNESSGRGSGLLGLGAVALRLWPAHMMVGMEAPAVQLRAQVMEIRLRQKQERAETRRSDAMKSLSEEIRLARTIERTMERADSMPKPTSLHQR